jgi:hypothetical protein
MMIYITKPKENKKDYLTSLRYQRYERIAVSLEKGLLAGIQ